jgi:hypothetical protein
MRIRNQRSKPTSHIAQPQNLKMVTCISTINNCFAGTCRSLQCRSDGAVILFIPPGSRSHHVGILTSGLKIIAGYDYVRPTHDPEHNRRLKDIFGPSLWHFVNVEFLGVVRNML